MVRRWLASVLFAVAGPANAADLSLQRVMLSSGGVGYFEYEAAVDGNATLKLDAPIVLYSYSLIEQRIACITADTAGGRH